MKQNPMANYTSIPNEYMNQLISPFMRKGFQCFLLAIILKELSNISYSLGNFFSIEKKNKIDNEGFWEKNNLRNHR